MGGDRHHFGGGGSVRVRVTGVRVTGVRVTGVWVTGVRVTRVRVRVTGVRVSACSPGTGTGTMMRQGVVAVAECHHVDLFGSPVQGQTRFFRDLCGDFGAAFMVIFVRRPVPRRRGDDEYWK